MKTERINMVEVAREACGIAPVMSMEDEVAALAAELRKRTAERDALAAENQRMRNAVGTPAMEFVVRSCKYGTGRLYIETEDGRFIGSVAPDGPLWADREKMASLMCDALNKQQTGEK